MPTRELRRDPGSVAGGSDAALPASTTLASEEKRLLSSVDTLIALTFIRCDVERCDEVSRECDASAEVRTRELECEQGWVVDERRCDARRCACRLDERSFL